MKRIAFAISQDLSLPGFFSYAVLVSKSLINKDIFFYLYDMIKPWSFDFEQHKYENLIQKRSMGPYVAKMFFIQSKQMKLSGYAGVWYKNI